MRKGPSPLSVHIGMATAAWPYNFPEDVMQGEMPDDLRKMLLGIRLYHEHGYKRSLPMRKTAWKQGEVSLQVLPEQEALQAEHIVLLVPSLINKSTILDLCENRSMMRWFAAQKIKVYLLDWGKSVSDPMQENIDDLVIDRFLSAINFISRQEKNKLHILGYCMGGTLSVAAAVHAKDAVRSLILLAASWDFHAGSQALLSRVKFWTPSAAPMMEEKGFLPVDWIQMLFASLDPVVAATKFAKFSDMDQTSQEAELFVAVEDWLNDGVDLPATLARQCIEDWFFYNLTQAGTWEVGGRTINAQSLDRPILAIASSKDKVVEFETARAVVQGLKGSKIIDAQCGHIGMIAGKKALNKVWNPIKDWVFKCVN